MVPNADIAPEYLYAVLDSACSELQSRGHGTTFAELSRARLGSFRLSIPPPAEQTAIAYFLGYATSRIERQIRAKEKLIALLEEQRQVLVHDAVTGRVDVRTGKPYPAYKSSGVEWLVDVPAHWELLRLKSLMANIVDYSNASTPAGAILALEHVESWTGKLKNSEHMHTPVGQSKSFRAGDILFGKLRPYLAKVTRPETEGRCVGEFIVLRSRHERFDGRFAEYFLRSKSVIDTINGSTYGARMPRAEWMSIGNLSVVCPPIREQSTISRFLDDAIANITRAIARANREIKLLREYRTRLIADVVTGKLDVRNAAARLSDETAAPVREASDPAPMLN